MKNLKDYIKGNKLVIVFVLLFFVFFILRIVFGNKLTFIEIFINFIFFIFIGYLFGKVFKLIKGFLEKRKLILFIMSLLIILFLFLFFIPLMSINFEKTGKIYNGNDLTANIRLIQGNCDDYPLGYQIDPTKENPFYAEYEMNMHFEPFWDIDKRCICSVSKECEDEITKQIKRQYGNFYGDEYTVEYGNYVLAIKGGILQPLFMLSSLSGLGCQNSGFTQFLIVPQRNIYAFDTSVLCRD